MLNRIDGCYSAGGTKINATDAILFVNNVITSVRSDHKNGVDDQIGICECLGDMKSPNVHFDSVNHGR